jgi:predicted double-glycine peptidase
MSMLMPSSNFGSGHINFLSWRKVTAIVLCFLLAFGHLPASGAVLSDRTLGSIVVFGLGEVSEAAVPQDGTADPTPAENDQPQSAAPGLVVPNQASALSEEQVNLPSEGEPAAADISYSAAPPESSGISSEDQPTNGTYVSSEAIGLKPAETVQPQESQVQQAQEQLPETIKPETDGMVLQSTAYTCGPAALATLLKMIGSGDNYYQQISELAQAGQNGTSLLALRHSAEALGYQAAGYRLNIKELAAVGPVLAHVVIGGYHHFTAVEGIADEAVFLADPQLGRVSIPVEQFKGVWSGAVLKISAARPIEVAPAVKEYDKTSDAAKHPVVPAGTEPVGPALPAETVPNLPAEEMSGAQEAAAAAGAEPVGILTAAASADHAPESPPASQAATESMAGAVPAGAEEQQVTETPAVENATAATKPAEAVSRTHEATAAAGAEALGTPTAARQQEIVGVPESTVLLPEIAAAAELPATELPVPTSLKEHADFTQERPSSSSQLLAETEMAEIEGRGIFLVPLAVKAAKLAPAAIGAANVFRKAAPAVTTRMSNARSLGIAGERAAGITGRKSSITLPNGKIRVPDSVTENILTEVKNVRSLNFTSQLRDYSNFAQSQGLRFELYVRSNTKLSRPLQNAINQGTIIRRNIPGF